MNPNIAIIHVNCLRGPSLRFWLPLFLLWIPAILLAPFIFLALIIACLISGVPFWRSIAIFWELLCSLPGTDVRVAAEGNHVLVRIL